MPERLQVVDENDQPIGVSTREEAWAKGLILRHAYIVLKNENGDFLLQQRSLTKKASPGLWTWAATGHVDEGETYEQAAARELYEEIGVETELTFVGKYQNSHPNKLGMLRVFISVFSGTIAKDTKLTIDPEEVSTTKWTSPSDLAILMDKEPGQFTVNMQASYHRFFE